MAITWTVGADHVRISEDTLDNYCCRKIEGCGKYAEFKAMDLDKLGDSTEFWIKDWNQLDDTTKAEVGSQYLIFDKDTRAWVPQ